MDGREDDKENRNKKGIQQRGPTRSRAVVLFSGTIIKNNDVVDDDE